MTICFGVFFWPRSVFGILSNDSWRWFEHTLWVLFEDVFLIWACIQSTRELKEIAINRAKLEVTNQAIEKQILIRTEQLADREAELSAIVHAAPDAILTVDEQWNVRSFNRASLRIFGLKKSEMRQGDVRILLDHSIQPPECMSQFLRAHQRSMDPSRTASMELSGKRSNADVFPMEVTVTMIPSDSGPQVYLWVIRDITERRQAADTEAELHRQRVETARVAGMSEIATGVLHNVGNALNSVNVSANLLQSHFRNSKLDRVGDVADLMQDRHSDLADFITEDEKGRQIPPYLKSLSDQLTEEQRQANVELDQLVLHICHIKTIVATQQAIAKPVGLTERVSLEELVDESLSVHIGPRYADSIRVIRNYKEFGPIVIDRARVMQILFNLVSNAKDSVRDSATKSPRIEVSIFQEQENICVSIADNGQGIESDQLIKIFQHGFTTKEYGHGFGLHSSINAANEAGLQLTATSKGKGKGATFTLSIPIAHIASDGFDAETVSPAVLIG